MLSKVYVVWPLLEPVKRGLPPGSFVFSEAKFLSVVHTFFHDESQARNYAVHLAKENPRVPFSVLTLGEIYETGEPTVIQKEFDTNQQLIVKGPVESGGMSQVAINHRPPVGNQEGLAPAQRRNPGLFDEIRALPELGGDAFAANPQPPLRRNR